nr:MAG TPA: Interleukin-12 alpha subunit [Microviridae sp.]
MFTLDLKVAKQNYLSSNDDIILFVVRLSDGRNLSVFFNTSECLLTIMENIKEYRLALKEYLSNAGYSYGSLKCAGYAE